MNSILYLPCSTAERRYCPRACNCLCLSVIGNPLLASDLEGLEASNLVLTMKKHVTVRYKVVLYSAYRAISY